MDFSIAEFKLKLTCIGAIMDRLCPEFKTTRLLT